MDNNDSITKYLSHIVIDPYDGTYTLLDRNLETVDTIYRKCNIPIIRYFYKKFELISFIRELKSDYEKFKQNYKQLKSKNNFILPSTQEKYKSLKEAYHKIIEFLFLCPDADYQILKLIKDNITNINPFYKNYIAACAEYLDELASNDPDKCNLPFDLNYACEGHFDDLVLGNHIKLANTFPHSYNPVEKYISIVSNKESCMDFIDRNNIYLNNEYTDYTTAKSISLDSFDSYDKSVNSYPTHSVSSYPTHSSQPTQSVSDYPTHSSQPTKSVNGYPTQSVSGYPTYSSQPTQSVNGYPTHKVQGDSDYPGTDR